ncbi:MAG: hypothetical protein WA584_22650 [Pyrinomonadaceae bacterium]
MMNNLLKKLDYALDVRRRLFYLLSSSIAFLIIFSRRPDAILNAQFWAEDGKVWYADAYNHGAIYSLFTPVAGYYQTISRIVAVVSQAFPLGFAPLIFNLAAISCKILVVNFLLSSRLSRLIPNISVRVLIAFIYLALPHSNETHANLTNAQWHLALLSFLIIIATPGEKTLWKIFDVAMISISALSGPCCLLLLPVAAIKWFKTRESRTIVLLIILAVASLIQISSLLTTQRPSQQPLGATFGLFLKIIGGHLFLDAIVGDRVYSRLFSRSLWNEWAAIPVNLLGFGLLIYAFVKSNLELRLLIIFSFLIVFSALAFPAVSSEVPQWTAMWAPGIGSRYWLIPIFCCFVSLLYLAKTAGILFVRYAAILLLAVSLFGIAADWKYPRFKDLEFQKYAAEFENAPAGQEVVVPINPAPWEMRLVKK